VTIGYHRKRRHRVRKSSLLAMKSLGDPGPAISHDTKASFAIDAELSI